MKNNFRYDINGLRAYAVAFVVLFHFGIGGFSAGFIGVDIFFVISGFLMTKIIVTGLEKNNFSFLKFYLARANRIIPALVFLCVAIALIGWFTLTPHELRDYGKHAFASLGFLSNIQYYREAGYFDAASHEKLLLHTWSLSVEWQFYILLPIFLFLVYRISKNIKILKISYVALFIASLCLSIILTPKYPTAAFYLLPTRAWEMLAGGLIFLFFDKNNFTKKISYLLEISGFFLIIISVYLFSVNTSWPSYNALIPVLGSFLILLASNQNSILTNNKIAQFLGNSSYSIYLWHWPIVFYLAYLRKSDQVVYIALAIPLSIFLGWLSYRFIETTSKNLLSNKNIKSGYLLSIPYISIPAAIFLAFFIYEGVPSRLSPEIQRVVAQADNKNPLMSKCHIFSGLDLPECKHGTSDLGLIVIGDSHASAMMPAIVDSLPTNKSLIEWSYSGCPTVSGIRKINSPEIKCAEFLEIILKKKDKYKNIPILIVNRTNMLFHSSTSADPTTPLRYLEKPFGEFNDEYYSTMKNAYVETLCKFSENHDVYVTTPIPVFDFNVPKTMAHRLMTPGSFGEIQQDREKHLNLSRLSLEALETATKKCNVKVLDTTDYFCDEKYCYPDKNGIPLYYDGDHVSLTGGALLTPLFKKIFQ